MYFLSQIRFVENR
nr:unnamed protein product [Callosobruchus analis]CAI5865151.1 unnamed protein product [Callosobruchus analis]CAI5866682.1 unnamed protein product [Callosobruchus analis]